MALSIVSVKLMDTLSGEVELVQVESAAGASLMSVAAACALGD